MHTPQMKTKALHNVSVNHHLSSEDSCLEYLAAAAASTTTVVYFAATIQTICTIDHATSIHLPIHSLKKQEVTPARGLVILIRISIVQAITHV